MELRGNPDHGEPWGISYGEKEGPKPLPFAIAWFLT
jgi:hypothetical protein